MVSGLKDYVGRFVVVSESRVLSGSLRKVLSQLHCVEDRVDQSKHTTTEYDDILTLNV